MALTQMQLIQSLGEALAWFEREISWGVKETELRHLCGRIGELYVAMITNGQMAAGVNERGYDVVSAKNERISVKTTAQSGLAGHVSFNANTLDLVDRVVVLRINTIEMQVETLLDKPVADVRAMMVAGSTGRLAIALSRLAPGRDAPRLTSPPMTRVHFEGLDIHELESGTIEIRQGDVAITPVMPRLRELALRLHVSLLNECGNPYNTRQLGTQVIRSIQELQTPTVLATESEEESVDNRSSRS